MDINEAKNRMRSRRWGVFNHFLYGNPGGLFEKEDLTDWNRRVELFDTDRLAKDLYDVGAGYYFITLMQGRKYMCAPNATFDEITGHAPGEACAKRDLILDLSDSLAKYDIDLYLYYTGDGPYRDTDCGEKFGFTEPRENITLSFVRKWAAVLEEYAVRYGERVKGWWIDGCYDFFGYDQEKLKLYDDAVKRGNPSALVSMNNGLRDDLYRWYEKEDFTSGEFVDFTYIPGNADVFPSVPHILAPLGISPQGRSCGAWWASPGCFRDGDYMKDYINKVNKADGVVSIDIQIRYDSTWDPEQKACLSKING